MRLSNRVLLTGLLLILTATMLHFQKQPVSIADAQGSIVYDAFPAFYKDRMVFYYIFNNGTPVEEAGQRVGVVDQYRLVDSTGQPISGQLDIIPSGGVFTETYSDLREIVEVQVPDGYEANTYTSVEALEAAGLLAEENITRTGRTVNVPLVFPGSELQGRDHTLITLWENGREVVAFDFGQTPAETAPIYVLVGDDAGTMIEGVAAVIEQMHNDAGYSDFWQVFQVRVPEGTDPNSIRSLADIEALGLTVRETPNVINCPAIRLENMNKAYVDDTLYHITQIDRPDISAVDTLPPLYLPESQAEGVLRYGTGDAGYQPFCQPVSIESTSDLLTNTASIEENTGEFQSASTATTCAILAEVLPGERE